MVIKDTAVTIDPYRLVEALTGRRLERQASSSKTVSESDYDDLFDVKTLAEDNDNNRHQRGQSPDAPPKDVHVGAINPYALVETLLGRKIDRCSTNSARVISDVLQTDYDELFDMRHDSILYAGLKLNERERRAEEMHERDMQILEESDLITPDLSRVEKLDDLEQVGLRDTEMGRMRVKCARLQNGKLRLVLDAPHSMGKRVSNRQVTMTLNELVTPFRMKGHHHWTPPNSSWQDMYGVLMRNMARSMINDMRNFQIGGMGRDLMGYRNRSLDCCESRANSPNGFSRSSGFNGYIALQQNQFDDPVQGATGNSFLIAAIFSVFWADPCAINRATRATICGNENGNNRDGNRDEKRRTLSIRFHDKGGKNNAKTDTVEVNYEIPINNSNNEPMYCRSSDGCEIWPSLYEKAFAKWTTGTSSDRPDITQASNGDPIKAMAQINGHEPHYYFTHRRSAYELVGLVRLFCVNTKTIHPMAAYTYATGWYHDRCNDRDDREGGDINENNGRRNRLNMPQACNIYRGSNLVANHAYSVLGWAEQGERQYVMLRNPWGVTEPAGLNSYPGLLSRVEPEFWRPAEMLDNGGVIAIEAEMFKEVFACIGVAK